MPLSHQPKYLKLSESLRQRILSGEFQAGERIPTEPQLMAGYGVSRNTVRQAVSRLEEGGYLLRRRGAGTLVRKVNAQGRPFRPLEAILFLLVDDVVEGEAYNVMQATTAQRWAAENGIAVVIATLDTEELLRGFRPAILDRAFYQAVFLDGRVTTMHCQIAADLGLPYLIVGNHPVSPGLPQVRVDMERAVEAMFDHAGQHQPDRPVAMLLEPLKLHISREMLLAYMQQINGRECQTPLWNLTADYQVPEALERLLKRAEGPVALILNGRHLEAAADCYRRRGLDPALWPIYCIIEPDQVAEKDRPFVCCVSLGGDNLIEEALVHFVRAYQSGSVDQIRIVRDQPRILRPRAQ